METRELKFLADLKDVISRNDESEMIKLTKKIREAESFGYCLSHQEENLWKQITINLENIRKKIMGRMGCPDCRGEIELYDTNKGGDSGKYRCLKCGRDTNWKVGISISGTEHFENMKKLLEKKND